MRWQDQHWIVETAGTLATVITADYACKLEPEIGAYIVHQGFRQRESRRIQLLAEHALET